MHQHSHAGTTGTVLKWSLAGTVLFVVIEALAGVRAGSLALLSDAGHNFTDALALLLAVFGFYIQSKPADEIKTYGYQRAGVLAAFVNALVLLLLSGYIFFESFHRLRAPRAVDESMMFIVAGAGLVLNVAIMRGLHSRQHGDLNVRAAFVHMLGDALGSAGIIAGAIVIHFTGWLWIDPVLSIFIAALIVWSAWEVTRDSLNILLEGLPRGMSLSDVEIALKKVPGVLGVHDLHIWSIGTATHALSCHVVIEDIPCSASEAVLHNLNEVLRRRFQIHHTTVQFEHGRCPLAASGCTLEAATHYH